MGDYLSDFFRGDSKSYSLSFKRQDPDTGVITPVDLTNKTIFFTMKEKENDSDDDAVIVKDITVHVDALNGLSSLSLTPTDTGSLIPGKIYYYDFQLVGSSSSEVTTLGKSNLTILQDITQRTS